MASKARPIANKQTSSLVERAGRAEQRALPELWRPTEVNDSIEGEVLKITQGGKFDSTFYQILTEDGRILTVAGGSTVLGKKLADEQVDVGDHIGIVYRGEGTSKAGRRFKDWYIEVRKPKREGAEPNDGKPREPGDDDIPF